MRLCNGRYTEDDIQKMEHILEQMKDIEDYQKVIECDQKFHQILVKKAGFQRIEKVWSDLDYFNIVSSYLVGFEEKVMIKRQYKIHRILIDACRTNDEDVICKAIYDHYMKSLEQFMKKEDIKCIHK